MNDELDWVGDSINQLSQKNQNLESRQNFVLDFDNLTNVVGRVRQVILIIIIFHQ